MSPPLIRLPAWLTAAAGVGVLATLALAAAGRLPVPAWVAAVRVGAPAGADVEAQAAAAETLMRRATRAIHAAKQQAGLALDHGDTDGSGALVGSELTPFVTTLGSLEAKRLASSPAWARVLTRELARAGVGRGAVITASFSGSFPGLNLAVVCAAQALEARLVAVTSVTSSTWGATDPGFTWPELEVRLVGMGIIEKPAVAAISIGGADDHGTDLEPDARAAARRIAIGAARTLGARVLEPASFEDAVQARITVFDERRQSTPIAVFVNVGGVEASLGRSPAILRMQSGWLEAFPADGARDGGVIARMSARGIPVLHLLNIRELGLRWGVR